MELTLFELHLDDSTFSANAPFSDRGEKSRDVDVGEEEESSGPSPVAFVVGLVFLVGVGLAIRRMMNRGSDDVDAEATTEPITAKSV